MAYSYSIVHPDVLNYSSNIKYVYTFDSQTVCLYLTFSFSHSLKFPTILSDMTKIECHLSWFLACSMQEHTPKKSLSMCFFFHFSHPVTNKI